MRRKTQPEVHSYRTVTAITVFILIPWILINYCLFITWQYNPLWVFRLLSQVSPSSSTLSCLLPVFYFQLFLDLPVTSCCHRCLGLPTGLFPIGLQSNSFPVGLARSIRWICPSHLILCALLNLTISAPSINISIFMLFRILYIFFIIYY